jgi:hypothetical protein
MRDAIDAETASEVPTDGKEAEKGDNASTETSEAPRASASIVEGTNGVSTPTVPPEYVSIAEGTNGVSTPTVPPEYVVMIQGKPFVRFAGLLRMAHDHHLVELAESWTYNDAELSLAHAIAIFEDGRRFEGSGDSSPANIGKKVALHWRRVALTRAKSRALRDALNIDMVAVEELGEVNDA